MLEWVRDSSPLYPEVPVLSVVEHIPLAYHPDAGEEDPHRPTHTPIQAQHPGAGGQAGAGHQDDHSGAGGERGAPGAEGRRGHRWERRGCVARSWVIVRVSYHALYHSGLVDSVAIIQP